VSNIVGCGMVSADADVATPSVLYLANRALAARIAEPSRARSSVGRAPPSHGGGHEFESRRVHSFFVDLQVKREGHRQTMRMSWDDLLQPRIEFVRVPSKPPQVT
jgi:hypothetical protein